jgi:hypothetical protein
MTKEEEFRLRAELIFMYNKYQELSEAYKKLANERGSEESKTKHDMSHMMFADEPRKRQFDNRQDK